MFSLVPPKVYKSETSHYVRGLYLTSCPLSCPAADYSADKIDMVKSPMDVVLLVCSETANFDWLINLVGDYLVMSLISTDISGWMCHSKTPRVYAIYPDLGLYLCLMPFPAFCEICSVYRKYQLIMSPSPSHMQYESWDTKL